MVGILLAETALLKSPYANLNDLYIVISTLHRKKMDRFMKKMSLSVLVAVLFSANVAAENDEVDRLFKSMDIEKQLIGGFEAMLPIIDSRAAQWKLTTEGKEELREIYRVWFNEDIDRALFLKQIKELYTKTFTDAELKSIAEFYESPTGVKFVTKNPEIMQLSAQLGIQAAKSKQAELLERVKPFLEKYQIK